MSSASSSFSTAIPTLKYLHRAQDLPAAKQQPLVQQLKKLFRNSNKNIVLRNPVIPATAMWVPRPERNCKRYLVEPLRQAQGKQLKTLHLRLLLNLSRFNSFSNNSRRFKHN